MSVGEKSLALLNHPDSLIPRAAGSPCSLSEQFYESIGILSSIAASSIDDSEIIKCVLDILDCRSGKKRLVRKRVITSGEWDGLKAFLDQLNDKSHVEATGDLRNAFHHSFSKRMVVGLSGKVTLLDNGLAYGVEQPMQMPELLGLLVKQRDIAFEVYGAYVVYARFLWEKFYAK